MSYKTLLFSLSIVALSFSACKKEEGPAGPAGKDGNANVKSLMITVNQGEWNGDGYGYYATKPCSIITQSIAQSGAVMCYIKDGDYFVALPHSIWWGDWTTSFVFAHGAGEIEFLTQDDDGFTPNPGQQIFKVVAIASSAMMLNPDVDLYDYVAVKEAFGLID